MLQRVGVNVRDWDGKILIRVTGIGLLETEVLLFHELNTMKDWQQIQQDLIGDLPVAHRDAIVQTVIYALVVPVALTLLV